MTLAELGERMAQRELMEWWALYTVEAGERRHKQETEAKGIGRRRR